MKTPTEDIVQSLRNHSTRITVDGIGIAGLLREAADRLEELSRPQKEPFSLSQLLLDYNRAGYRHWEWKFEGGLQWTGWGIRIESRIHKTKYMGHRFGIRHAIGKQGLDAFGEEILLKTVRRVHSDIERELITDAINNPVVERENSSDRTV